MSDRKIANAIGTFGLTLMALSLPVLLVGWLGEFRPTLRPHSDLLMNLAGLCFGVSLGSFFPGFILARDLVKISDLHQNRERT
jgi:hypothetical protein